MDTTSSSNVCTYIYCIARAEPFADSASPFRAQSVGGPGYPVYTVQFMDLAAVVSDSPAARYDVGRQNTLAHQRVIEGAMSRSEVLPVRFSTIARNPRQIHEQLLKRKFGEFHHLLQYVRGRAELGLKVFWNRERLFADITSESAQIRTLRDTLAGKPPEETHYQRIQLGQLTEEAIIRKRDEDAERIVQALRPLAFETKVNKILTDMMILNAAFLVDESNGPAFDAKVNELDDSQEGRLILKYVGPLPPYNFVNVVVHWEEE
ncbi:MAG TPA: GvpL/GvpF family gas vesicle protein [Thermoleophilia bacterium]|nr:GvpL/GvpF family gas vesicle protein [Thermoleophilia bacterium]